MIYATIQRIYNCSLPFACCWDSSFTLPVLAKYYSNRLLADYIIKLNFVSSDAGVNKQAVPAGIHKISMEQHLASQDSEQLTIESTASRKNSLDLRMDDNTGTRKNSMAAIACEGKSSHSS